MANGIYSKAIPAGWAKTGKVSNFGGPSDPSDSGRTASGGTTATPGIAMRNRATLGGYYLLQSLSTHRAAIVPHTDLGPADWTGREWDITYSAMPWLGNPATDTQAKGTYLGKRLPAGLKPGPVTVAADGTITQGAATLSGTASLGKGAGALETLATGPLTALADGVSGGGLGLFDGLGKPALKALLWVVLVGAGIALAALGVARASGVRTVISPAPKAAAS